MTTGLYKQKIFEKNNFILSKYGQPVQEVRDSLACPSLTTIILVLTKNGIILYVTQTTPKFYLE